MSPLIYKRQRFRRLKTCPQSVFVLQISLATNLMLFTLLQVSSLNLFYRGRDVMRHMTSCKQALQANECRCGSINNIHIPLILFISLHESFSLYQVFKANFIIESLCPFLVCLPCDHFRFSEVWMSNSYQWAEFKPSCTSRWLRHLLDQWR